MAYTENSTIGGLTALGEAPASADMVPIWDASAAATRMATVAELLTNAGGGIEFSTAIASLGSETGDVADGDTLLQSLAKINDRLPLAGGTLTGQIGMPAGSAATPAIVFDGSLALHSGSTGLVVSAGGESYASMGADMAVQADGFIGFSSSTSDATTTTDCGIRRDGAGLLAQRKGANAQESRVYNTYTDASNYERGMFAWRSNQLFIGSEEAGTGSFRNTYLVAHGSSMISMLSGQTFFKEHVRSNTSGTKDMGGSGSEWANLWLAQSVIQKEIATAPAGVAAKSHIYTEDDGSGKTRLMVIFGTGVAQQIAIEP